MGRGAHGGAPGAAHSHDPDYPDDTWNLYQHIAHTQALNAHAGTVGVFRPFVRRFETENSVVSDGDEEVIIKVVFASPCSLRRLMVIGAETQHPSHLRVYVGHEDLDFSSVDDVTAAYETTLPVNVQGEAFVNTHPPGPFTNVTSLAFFFDANNGDGETVVRYIGMQGEHSHDKRQAVNAKYELIGTPHGTTTQVQMDQHV